MNKLYGSHYALAKLPMWAIFPILFIVVSLAILAGRDFSEGIPYQVAYSAVVGEGLCFIAMVLIIATILQRQRGSLHIPRWLNGIMHFAILVMSCVISADIEHNTIISRSGWYMDIYHDLVVMPLILYLGATLLPIIWFNGEKSEKRAFWCFALLWVGAFVFDLIFNRINQFTWLLHHGVKLVR